MNTSLIIEEFASSWAYTRKMTNEFIKCVPKEKWDFSHHPKFGPLSQQFRHMVGVYGCYIDAFISRKMDLSKKKAYFSEPLNRENILSVLGQMDLKLKGVLNEIKNEDLNKFTVDFFGQSMGFTEYSHVLIQHECSHF
ncbi:MAG: hypothetical protein NT027_08495 [Proteobacteria bacterium]|nr:hypothetical protein [Pseudomonadota bacterium]